MAENRFGCGCPQTPTSRDTCCIETGRIYDSCRDRDCYENVRVNLTECGNDIISLMCMNFHWHTIKNS